MSGHVTRDRRAESRNGAIVLNVMIGEGVAVVIGYPYGLVSLSDAFLRLAMGLTYYVCKPGGLIVEAISGVLNYCNVGLS